MTPSAASPHAALPDPALDQLFRTARSYYAFLDTPVSDDTLRQLYDVMKWAPTSGNLSPARFLFLRSLGGEETARAGARTAQCRQGDERSGYGHRGLRPQVLRQATTAPPAQPQDAGIVRAISRTRRGHRPAKFQLARRLLDARGTALGLDCGPISGFDNRKVDDEFLAAGQPCEGCRRGVSSRGAHQVELPVQSRLRRPGSITRSAATPGVQ